MKRKDFFKKAFGIGGGVILGFTGLGSLSTEKEEDKSKDFKLMSTNIAGLRYYEGNENLKNICEGDAVQLVREPINIHDAKAIAIYWQNRKLGYIPRHHNMAVCSIMDAGITTKAQIAHINPEQSDWHKIYIRIFAEKNNLTA